MAGNARFQTAFERRGVIVPGLPVLEPGVERHPIPGGGTRTVDLEAGDEFGILDVEGLQQAELAFFARDRSSRASMVGATGAGRAAGILSSLAGGGPSGARVLNRLRQLGLDLEGADAVRALGDGSRPGDMEMFTADCAGTLVVAAPGLPMSPINQDCPSELILYVRRARLRNAPDKLRPPDPLADPSIDINIQPGEAKCFTVREGEFIQILDVQGRECSDFQAFSRRRLDSGKEREIDPTATRTLSGSAYPAPGLYSKFFSVDFEPLVEIVQDTCGRHDAFGLACTARYYEDMGYPGHLNCSDNMNAGLSEYGVEPRAGWPAINFFYNTNLDAANSIGMDDPWSRPGDYVLLRALTDLVCVSTACPCDVDPANDWNPTDIQVRTYGAREAFQKSIGYRKSPEADMEETKKTGFHDSFAKETRDFVEYAGYWLPNSITGLGTISEYWGCRERAAIMDLSPLRKYEITGPDAEDLMQLCVTRNMKKLSVGQVAYTAMCYEHGGMIDDGTVYRLGDNNFRWVGGADESGLWLRRQANERKLNAWVRNSTDQLHNIAVQGPKSQAILEKIFWTPPLQPSIAELGRFRFAVARIGGFEGTACVVSRTGYTGELGYEIFCHPSAAGGVYDAVREAGREFDAVPLGLAAMDMLRIEAGLIFAGQEFCDQTNPFEAGIGFAVPLRSRNDDFIGRLALEERSRNPVRKLVGLEVEGGVVPSPGDSVRKGMAQIGEVTSAVRSPILGRVIALARLDATMTEPGTDVDIGQLDGLQKRLRARVAALPLFDPERKRVRGQYEN